MLRREFIALVGGAVVAVPIARAQQLARIPHLGVLLFSTRQADPQIKFVLHGLRDLGYLEGRNIVIEYRFAEGEPGLLSELAAELALLKPDVIVAGGRRRGPSCQARDADDPTRVREQCRS